MTELDTLLAALDFSRARLLGLLDAIEKTADKAGQPVQSILAWRPGPGRAHLGWQAMHCAATHDRYVNVRIKNGSPTDAPLCEHFAGGSTPSDALVPTMPEIREKLARQYDSFKTYLQTADLNARTDFPNNIQRTVGESTILLAWHEAHHQGQMHLTWNLYKGAHSIA